MMKLLILKWGSRGWRRNRMHRIRIRRGRRLLMGRKRRRMLSKFVGDFGRREIEKVKHDLKKQENEYERKIKNLEEKIENL